MNNSATVVEVRIREKKGIILEPHRSGYFRTATCQRLSCSAQSFFSLYLLAPSHSSHQFTRYHMKMEQILLCLLRPWERPHTKQIGLALDEVGLALCAFLCTYSVWSGCACICLSSPGCVYNIPLPILKVVCQCVSDDYGCSFADSR